MLDANDDRKYLNKNPDWHAEDAPFKAAWIRKMIQRHLPIDDKYVADVGCGSGEILKYLIDSFPNTRFEGFEISEIAYSIAEQKTKLPHLKFHHTDLLQRDPNQTHYDLVLCIDVFEHIPDYLQFLTRLKAYADHFIFHIPLELSVQTVLRSAGLISYRKQYGHLHFFNRVLALHTLIECGYKIIDWQYTPSALVLPGRNLKSKILKLPRRMIYMINEDLCAKLLGGYSLMVFCSKKPAI